MFKDFRVWTRFKSTLEKTSQRLFFNEREIWYCHLGENIGFEQDGKGESFLRPVIVIRKFNNQIFWGIPLTRTHKKMPFYFSFFPNIISGLSPKESVAILSQVRLIDAKRLRRLVGTISEKDFSTLKERFKALLP